MRAVLRRSHAPHRWEPPGTGAWCGSVGLSSAGVWRGHSEMGMAGEGGHGQAFCPLQGHPSVHVPEHTRSSVLEVRSGITPNREEPKCPQPQPARWWVGMSRCTCGRGLVSAAPCASGGLQGAQVRSSLSDCSLVSGTGQAAVWGRYREGHGGQVAGTLAGRGRLHGAHGVPGAKEALDFSLGTSPWWPLGYYSSKPHV